jgi:MFS family permease
MLILAFSNLIGLNLGDTPDGDTPADHVWGISFAIFGLIWMNIAANVVQGPARALIGDLSPPNKQQIAQSLVTTSQMITAVVAPLIGVALFYSQDPASSPYQWLFLIGACVMVVTGFCTVFFGVEKSTLIQEHNPVSSATLAGSQQLLAPAPQARTVWF